MTIVRTLLAKLGMKVDKSGFSSGTAQMEGVKKRLLGIGKSAQTATGGIQGMIGALTGFQAAKGLIDTNIQAQKLAAQLESVTGSAEKGKAAFAFIKDFAKSTPFELNNVTQAFIKLKAAGIEPTKETMTAVGDLAAANATTISQAASAITKAGRGLTEEAESQLNIAGQVTQKQVKFTVQGVETTIKRTKDNITGFLLGVGKTKFAGSMAKQMETVGGKMSNLSDATTAFKVAIGEAGLNAAVMRLTQSLIDWTNASNGLAVSLGRGLGGAVDSLGASLEFLGRNAEAAKVATIALGSVFVFLKLQSAVLGVVTAITSIGTILGTVGFGIRLLLIQITAVAAGPVVLVAVKFGAVLGIVFGVWEALGGVKGILETFGPLIEAIRASFQIVFGAFLNALKVIFEATKRSIFEPFKAVAMTITNIIAILLNGLAPVITFIAEAIGGIIEVMGELFALGIDIVGGFIGPALELIKGIFMLVRGLFIVIERALRVSGVLPFIEKVWGALKAAVNGFRDAWKFVAGFVRDLAAKMLNPLFEILEDFVQFLKDVVGSIPDMFLPEELEEFARSETDFQIKTSAELLEEARKQEAILEGEQQGKELLELGKTAFTVENLAVNIQGNPNGSPDQIGKATKQGVTSGLEDVDAMLGDLKTVER